MIRRTSGLLLHVTSLPSRFGVGDLGPGAIHFLDYMARAGQSLWQILPLCPVGYGNSPYASPSTFAADEFLVSPERLVEDGLLTESDLAEAPAFPQETVAFEAARVYKTALLDLAHARFREGDHPHLGEAYGRFRESHAAWLDQYALFMALKDAHDGAEWIEWEQPYSKCDTEALQTWAEAHALEMDRVRFGQFLFWQQWDAVRAHARHRGIQVLGDLPIYVAYDSADVWANRHLFRLDENGAPTHVAGVPPDYFSETGQRWGNPLYRWDRMAETEYEWWRRRMAHTLSMVDLLRLDHFRGFEAFWSVPSSEPTAIHGAWETGPRDALFQAFERELGSPLPIIAEDLGLITPEVRHLMGRFGFPGMAIFQFAFGGRHDSDFLPHTFRRALAAYTGTHDNNTFQGWWDGEATEAEREHARAYLDLDTSGETPARAAVRALMASVADTVVTPMQDVLGLGAEARMNTPGTVGEMNWGWRVRGDQLTDDSARRMRQLTELYARSPVPFPEGIAASTVSEFGGNETVSPAA
ncbi:MAG: 4-alpha-glucanotransferase [Bacteroidota bacterium]